jgi:hypothetical protein
MRILAIKSGTPGAIRTHDKRFRKPLLYPLSYRGISGGDRGTRTPDLCIANAALSQLSYIPLTIGNYNINRFSY